MRLPSVAALALVVAGGCAHTKTTDEGREGEEQKETSGGSEKTDAQKPHAGGGAHEPTHGQSGGDHSVPLATAPGGLLAPGAEDKIRKRLAAEGCLDDDAKGSGGALSEGLRRCQKAHDLPETGMPDDATIKALGLNPDQIFRHGPVKD
jgi:hypothetical protein